MRALLTSYWQKKCNILLPTNSADVTRRSPYVQINSWFKGNWEIIGKQTLTFDKIKITNVISVNACDHLYFSLVYF